MRDGLPHTDTPTLDALNERQRKFVMAYIDTGVATKAYKLAGYTAEGNALEVNASRLLGNAKVLSAIDELRAATVARFTLGKEEALLEVLEEARDKKYNSGSERLKAWGLIGEWCEWKPRETKGPPPVIVQVNIDHKSVTAIS